MAQVAKDVEEKPQEAKPPVAKPKVKPVTIPQKVRQAYSWINRFVKEAQAKAMATRREKERLLGPQLSTMLILTPFSISTALRMLCCD